MSGPAPLLDHLRRGDVTREVRLAVAQAAVAPRSHEQASMLVLLSEDTDAEIRQAALATVDRIPVDTLRAFLARTDVPADVTAFFAARGIGPGATPAPGDDPLIDAAIDEPQDEIAALVTETKPETMLQKLQHMSFTDRVKAAMRGTREVRSILIRDPNKLIATSVLSSPKVSEAEIESFAKMATVSEDVLRTIAMNRSWTKNYSVVLALTKNSKTPLALSMTMLSRLNERDIAGICTDRNVPDPLRIAARRKLAANKG